MFVPGNALLKGMLADSMNVQGTYLLPDTLANMKVGLFTSGGLLTQDTLLTDLVQPTYNGYVLKSAGAFAGPFRQQDGSYAGISQDVIFQMADALNPTTVAGYFLTDGATGKVFIGGEVFDTPRVLQTVDDAVALVVVLTLAQASIGGGGVHL